MKSKTLYAFKFSDETMKDVFSGAGVFDSKKAATEAAKEFKYLFRPKKTFKILKVLVRDV